MAYIDVDLLKESVLGWNPPLDTEQLKHMIDTIPCADVVEVKHGKWSRLEGEFVCSNCYNIASASSAYCPLCGTKMDVPPNVGEKEGAKSEQE